MTDIRLPHFSSSPSLIAIVLELTPLDSGALPFHVGYANLAAALAYLGHFHPAFIATLHDEDAPKPLTCSTLMGKIHRQQGLALLRPGEQYWVRITGLNEETCKAISSTFLETPPSTWVLAGQKFQVRQVICDPSQHPWSGAATYAQLYHRPAATPPDKSSRKINMEIASPTAFRSDGITLTLPQPDLFFGSLLDRWNSHSTLPMPELPLRGWCRSGVEASRFQLETVLFESKKRVQHVGAVGSITYSIREPQPEMVGWLNLLAGFAFYSGVGMKTSMGMGQVRRV